MHRLSFVATLAAVALSLAEASTAQGKNLLFYGNSYSSRNGTVANMVQRIAVQAGRPTPTIVKRFASSQDLDHHATNSGQVAAISNSLPNNQDWDFVVMQGQSTEATQALGDPADFRANAAVIMGNVRNHSPSAKAVLYQTWARALTHHYYPNTFANPISMHHEIRGNYQLASNDINAQFGADSARNSAVGDGVALLEWQPTFYEPDLFHPRPAMTLLAGMCLYTSIYEERICEITVNFNQGGSLVNWLNGLGLSQTDWYSMASIADRCAAPHLRPHPGSGDFLQLESGTLPGRIDSCGTVPISAGSLLVMRLTSLNGVYDASPGLLLINLFPNGTPPTPSVVWPELLIDTSSMLILASSSQLSNPLNIVTSVPLSFPGASILLQGFAWGASTETGNIDFTTTDAHELVFQ